MTMMALTRKRHRALHLWLLVLGLLVVGLAAAGLRGARVSAIAEAMSSSRSPSPPLAALSSRLGRPLPSMWRRP